MATARPTAPPPVKTGAPVGPKEPLLEQIASIIGFFIWLLVFKSFFLQLFIIPTGSMAETLCGAHARHTCPNCGFEYQVGFDRAPDRPEQDPREIQCPNCRWGELFRGTPLQERMRPTSGDRIVVHGWPYVLGGWLPALGPQAWEVVVFKNPNEPDVNYIKRLIGLPGQKVEIIDGDVFINDQVARKAVHAQRSLWFSYYDHDYYPKSASQSGYFPHWAALEKDNGWTGLGNRAPRFDGRTRPRGEIRFVTRNDPANPPGEIVDLYGYNAPGLSGQNAVRDVRLSCEVTLEDGDGYVELSATKYTDRFYARLYADGRVELECEKMRTRERGLWGKQQLAPPRGRPVQIALSNVDYVVSVEIDGKPVLLSKTEQYGITPGEARRQVDEQQRLWEEQRSRKQRGEPPDPNLAPSVTTVQIAAERVNAEFARLRIERDVYYTQMRRGGGGEPGNATQGHPIQLGPDQYFVLGDNSPCSADARYWETPGPHLRNRKDYQVGTVPADQMIGPAFLVYWPGFLPLFPGGPNMLPDLGRVRWIY